MYEPAENRYGEMEYRRCGQSGLVLSAVSLGCWHNFGGALTEDMEKLCFAAFDSGVTHFDLADNYGPPPGSAEENLGRILKKDFAAHRDELIVSSKAGYYMWPGPYGDWGGRKHLIAGLEQSLRRLQLDYVDIFYHHRMDGDTPLEETMLALNQIVRSGKALYVGLSNYNGETLRRAEAILRELRCPFVICQNRLSIFDRSAVSSGLLDAARELGKGVICFSPLAQGTLTDRYLHGIPADSRAARDPRYLKESDITPHKLEQIAALNALALARGESLAQMALGWLLHQGVTSVIMGASKPEQIRQNVRAAKSAHFTQEELEEIDRISLN
jgi:L-glyceraldehyde 3-phosphate reductase